MLNVAALNGRLVADPELKTTQTGLSVCSFRIAVDRSYSKGQERQADFIDIVTWRQTAEFVSKYFRKGQLVAVQGSIQTRTWQDKDGNKRYSVEVVADQVHFAERKQDSSGSGHAAPARFENEPAPAYQSGDTGDFVEVPGDDDLPF